MQPHDNVTPYAETSFSGMVWQSSTAELVLLQAAMHRCNTAPLTAIDGVIQPSYLSYTKFSDVSTRSLSVGAFVSLSERMTGSMGQATPMSGSFQRMLPSHSGA